jgi:hypothetical protein
MNAFSSRKSFALVASLFIALMTGCAANPDTDGEQDGTQETAPAPAAASADDGDQKAEQLKPMGIAWGTVSQYSYRCEVLALNGLDAAEMADWFSLKCKERFNPGMH